MILVNEIPNRFWSLFRPISRSAYIETLLKINEEYGYGSYFLSRETCTQLLNEYFSRERYILWQDETEDNWDILEPSATRVLNWLLRSGWLRKVDDYANATVNIVIPDYVAVMIETFAKPARDEENETKIYTQDVYAIPFSLKSDPQPSITPLNTALVNAKKLNKSLQGIFHNMSKFFGGLLEQKNCESLLEEYLGHYVEEIVNRRYRILRTSNDFCPYKIDIERWITITRQDEKWTGQMCARPAGFFMRKPSNITGVKVMEKLDQLEHGFDDMEHRTANMDKEHTRYVRTTVTRLNYFLNQGDDMRGLVVQLLSHLSEYDCPQEDVSSVGARMNLSQVSTLSGRSLYKRRRTKMDFKEQLEDKALSRELFMEEALNLNKIGSRYSRREIEDFIETHMENGIVAVGEGTVSNDEEFERLILAYDCSICLRSAYEMGDQEPRMIHNDGYTYPDLILAGRKK